MKTTTLRDTASQKIGRRSILSADGTGGLPLGFLFSRIEGEVAYAARNVNCKSIPSDLKITNLRIAELGRAPMRVPIIRIDTNQEILGLGELRDGGDKRYALILKRRLLGENPCNIGKV
ncbi:MAG: hypothetical protein O2960_05085 [Verrucomicrobia bacterium]|nr:hypothetical protein [Verrucomicrobiota bacterium]